MPRSLADLDWPVTTERLSIRPATTDDIHVMFGYRSQEPVARWMTAMPADEAAFEEQLTPKLERTLMIEQDGVVVGDLYVAVGDAWSQTEVADLAKGVQAEIGWCLDPRYGGQGFGTEAAAALLRICFEGLQLRRVFAQCFADNVPSWRIMERLGMRREQHTIKESLHRSGEWLDGMMYALLADEWVSQR